MQLKPKIHQTTITQYHFFYERQTWSSTLRKELKLTVFGNRVQKGISGRRKIAVSARRQEKKLYNVYVYNLCSSKNTIRVTSRRVG